MKREMNQSVCVGFCSKEKKAVEASKEKTVDQRHSLKGFLPLCNAFLFDPKNRGCKAKHAIAPLHGSNGSFLCLVSL